MRSNADRGEILSHALCSAENGGFELIVLKNSCLIEVVIADSIPLLIGGFGDDGTKAGGTSGAVLRI
ncbi:hypothetical protein, partial [Cognatishimia sp. MH4019]|uniref:hypothetical protein n=1 Tax=Cognatishimia sp. MH4019 TaxID=2854030 RepID=UPI001CD19555